MICEYFLNLIRKICCCNIFLVKKGKYQKLKLRVGKSKNIKEYSPINNLEKESDIENNSISKRNSKISAFWYIIFSLFLICFIIYFILKIYELISENKKIEFIKEQEEKKNEMINNTKVCLCTLGKEENLYIREFVQHYEKYGVDTIFLYDNNDEEGEKFEEVINDYIQSGFVQIMNWRGKKQALMLIMNDCYQRNYQNYDWLIFYELDEYIHLSNYTNIKPFLNEHKFDECQLIYLNLICHSDNNLLYYENKSLAERFPERVSRKYLGGYRLEIKSILRGHIPNVTIYSNHILTKKLINCNGYGNRNKFYYDVYSSQNDFKHFYIDHYYSKSTEEFIGKINKGDAWINTPEFILGKIDKYFSQSKMTEEKLNFIENKTRLNLSKYWEKLKNDKKK